ncbi:TetR/AcrR family transcriptional regulator C-terminal domain-containing protein [Streptococcus orisasini]
MLTQLTKWHFANTLKNMLKETPFEKIRVTSLCKQAQVSPQTFYNHFQDKYDLVAWIYLQDYNLSQFGNLSYSPETILKATQQLLFNKDFYQKVYQDQSQNSINDYITSFNLKTATNLVTTHLQLKELTKEQELAIKYHNYGVISLFEDLIYDRLDVPLEDLAKFNYDKTPDFLKEAISHTYSDN